ncbi:MAG: integrase [Verrucomicrobiales bacterium]|jgi:integrase
MATIFRKKGSPFYWTAFYDADGRRRYRSTKSKRKTEAISIASEMELASRRVGDGGEFDRRILAILEEATEKALRHRLNTDVARDLLNRILECSTGEKLFDPTLEEWFRSWVEDKKKSRAEKTAIRYEGVINSFLDFLTLAKRRAPLGALTIDDVRRYRDKISREGRAEATVNFAVKTLRAPLNAARKQGLIVHNPAEGVDLVTVEVEEKGVFSPEDVAKLVRAADGDWKGLILGGYYTGSRLGDISNLDWKSVNLEEGLVEFIQAKTKRRVNIPLHGEFKGWLESIKKEDRKGPVFPSLAGTTSSGRSGLSGQFKKILTKAGLKGQTVERKGKAGRNRSSLSFHSLRHSFNSAMATAGIPQEIRQKLTGHASKAVNDRYTHTELGTLKEAIESLPSLSKTS